MQLIQVQFVGGSNPLTTTRMGTGRFGVSGMRDRASRGSKRHPEGLVGRIMQATVVKLGKHAWLRSMYLRVWGFNSLR